VILLTEKTKSVLDNNNHDASVALIDEIAPSELA
jgi:hypothetical protein